MVKAPPASQIDCLLGIPREPTEPPQMYHKESDSNYIRLAKMGGRQDLLRFRENKPNVGPPKDYPRTGWYYLEDNQLQHDLENANKSKERYEFGQPDYMVHLPFNADAQKPQNECPYATDKNMNMSNCNTHDKTVPEVVKSGYGLRSKYPLDKSTFPCMERARHGRSRSYITMGDDRVDMEKLMSNSYKKEWTERMARVQERRDKAQESLNDNDAGAPGHNASVAAAGALPKYNDNGASSAAACLQGKDYNLLGTPPCTEYNGTIGSKNRVNTSTAGSRSRHSIKSRITSPSDITKGKEQSNGSEFTRHVPPKLDTSETTSSH